ISISMCAAMNCVAYAKVYSCLASVRCLHSPGSQAIWDTALGGFLLRDSHATMIVSATQMAVAKPASTGTRGTTISPITRLIANAITMILGCLTVVIAWTITAPRIAGSM